MSSPAPSGRRCNGSRKIDFKWEKMKPFEPKQLHVTLERDDVATLKNIVAANLDDSGIIAHILDEMGS